MQYRASVKRKDEEMEHCHRLLSLWCAMTTITLGAFFTGPEPTNVVAPLDSMVTFTCVVNTTETPAGTKLLGINSDELVIWLVNGTVLTYTDENGTLRIANGTIRIVNGTLRIATRQLTVTRDYRLVRTTELVQCALATDRIKANRSAYRMSALVAIRSTCWCRSRHVT